MYELGQADKQFWRDEGYLVLRQVIETNLIQGMRVAIDKIVARAIAGEFVNPPFQWIDEQNRIPNMINDLLCPRKYDPTFGETLDACVLPIIECLLGTTVRMSWLTAFPGGSGFPYSTPFHRDNNAMGSRSETELNECFLNKQCYFQFPLLPDDRFLQLVPGSHLRPATENEIAASACGWEGNELPGMVTIDLQPGDMVLRQTNTIHRGWNPDGQRRLTLVSSLWAADMPMLEIEKQDYDELSESDFVNALPPRTQAAVKNYLAAYKQVTTAGRDDSRQF